MPNVNPDKPRSDSQRTRILAYLLEGHHITSQYALRHFGCARLASRIHEIQKTREVKRRMIQVTTADGGTARVAEYFIDPADLNN